MRKYIKTFESYTSQATRLDNMFDMINNRFKVNDEVVKNYIKFNEKHLDEIEKIIKEINYRKYIWTADLPMFWTADSLDDLSNNEEQEIKVFKLPIESIEYSYTYYYTNPVEGINDKYRLIYDKYTEDLLSEKEILKLIENGAIMEENGIIGMDEKSVRKYIKKIL